MMVQSQDGPWPCEWDWRSRAAAYGFVDGGGPPGPVAAEPDPDAVFLQVRCPEGGAWVLDAALAPELDHHEDMSSHGCQ